MAKMPKSVELEVLFNSTVVKPGDTLVVAINIARPLSEQEADDIRQRLQEVLPGVRVIPVVASALAVYHPDKE